MRLGYVGRRRAGDRLSPPTPGSPPPPVAPGYPAVTIPSIPPVASRPAWTPRNPSSVSPRRPAGCRLRHWLKGYFGAENLKHLCWVVWC